MSRGFSLLEIMVSLAILSIGLLALIGSQGNSLRASGRAENIQMATLLGRQRLNEKILELNKDMAKGTFPDENEEQGTFDEPNEEYRWEIKIRKVQIPVLGDGGGEAGAAGGGSGTPTQAGGDTVAAPESAQRGLAQMVSKKISESIREVSAKVIWDEIGEEQSLTLTTHIAKVP